MRPQAGWCGLAHCGGRFEPSEIYHPNIRSIVMKLTDAHVHLPEYQDPSDVIRNARARGMRLLSCTVRPAQAELNVRLAEENPGIVKCFLGVHPSDAPEDVDADSLEPIWGAAAEVRWNRRDRPRPKVFGGRREQRTDAVVRGPARICGEDEQARPGAQQGEREGVSGYPRHVQIEVRS